MFGKKLERRGYKIQTVTSTLCFAVWAWLVVGWRLGFWMSGLVIFGGCFFLDFLLNYRLKDQLNTGQSVDGAVDQRPRN